MKKLVALLLCIVMIVGVVSTAAFADEKDAAKAAYDKLLKAQEYGIAQGMKNAFDAAAKQVVADWGSKVEGLKSAEEIRDVMFGIFSETVKAEFKPTGDYAKDAKAFVAAAIKGYQAAGKDYMENIQQFAIQAFIAGLVADGKFDQDVIDLIDAINS